MALISSPDELHFSNTGDSFMSKFVIRILRALSFRFDARVDSFLLNDALGRVGALDATKIQTWTKPIELHTLLNLAAACPRGGIALEIGSYVGASACYLVAGLARVDGHLFCVDTWHNETMPGGERDTFDEFLRNTSNVKKWISVIRKKSGELNIDDTSKQLDFVFIDGDHSYLSVKTDFECTSRWVSEDGIVVFHDSNFEGVSRIIGEALASGKWEIGGHVVNLFWIKRARFTR